jgi:hypothetical protein
VPILQTPETSAGQTAVSVSLTVAASGADLRYVNDMELIFEIRDAEEGGYCARALGHAIFTEAETWEELRNNALEAVSLHFEDCAVRPRIVQLHYVRDELIPVEAA